MFVSPPRPIILITGKFTGGKILVVSLSIRDEHPGFAYDQTQDDYVTIDLHLPL